tara:strand:+ start:1844 stop:2281 length:438 start_codon:yes stop_codon:yes gene_type:complete
MANSATQTRAFNAIFSTMDSSSRKVVKLSSKEYFKHTISVFDYITKLRETKGDFTSTLGLNSVDNGGTIRMSENGRCSIWFNWADNEASVTVSSKLSERMLKLCGDTDFRAVEGGGVEALRTCYPLFTEAFFGIHKDTGVLMLAV